MRRINYDVPLTVTRPLVLSLMVAVLTLAAPESLLLGWPDAVSQARPTAASRSAWPVGLPATATVRLRQGGSLSGRLVALTATTLTLAVGQQSQTVPRNLVSSVEFAQPNDLWVSLPRGRRQLRPIRGLSLPVDPLPSAAIQLDRGSETALVDLTTVFSEAQFAKLTRNPEVVHVLKRLEVNPEGNIGLWVRPYGMLP
jgi:hypothetical protein